MSLLVKLRESLLLEKPTYQLNFAIPSLFNLFGHNSLSKLKSGEELINPYDFLVDLIDNFFLNDYKNEGVKSLSAKKGLTTKSWLKKAVFYSMLVRTSSAWDHDRNESLDVINLDGLKETGTFIKTLMLLPLLKEMGVNALYLLPIFKYSLKNKKGEIGSPYSVSNFFELDENLKDPLVGNRLTLEEQFQVLVEACHAVNIRVLIDIIPRTNALESDLLVSNPEWFYWINSKDLVNYKPPFIESLKEETVAPLPKYMKEVYSDKNVLNHLSLFKLDPKTQNPKLWEKVIKEYNENNKSILDIIDKHFKMTVAPAFSDHLNDIQPPWSDVTFFRMYLDHPSANLKYLKNKNIPPYILFDTIKANLYPGKVPNLKLWELITNIIPYYQKTFGIDGARIDMGHALPEDLVKKIILKAKEIDPSFVFIAEELNPNNASKAKKLGYDMIIGNSFSMAHKVYELEMHDYMLNTHKLPLPQFALAETHDTPRIASSDGGKILSRFITIMNMFIPNTVPFINSGQEVYELQAMNLGINPRENELFMLEKDDPYYGKLALFDKYAFHYLDNDNQDIKNHLKIINKIRTKYLTTIINKNNYIPIKFNVGRDPIGFIYKSKKELLFIIGNPFYDFTQTVKIDLNELTNKYNLTEEAILHYGTYESESRIITEFDENNNPYFLMGPGEIKIFTITRD